QRGLTGYRGEMRRGERRREDIVPPLLPEGGPK
ncbi:MAG TPA: NADH-quinone oxidoreductase subunit C, partial [Deinococcus radiodurans]|nr:NADH-quinone oxidoreductase subunit C [Deinococcus radiodurans]